MMICRRESGKSVKSQRGSGSVTPVRDLEIPPFRLLLSLLLIITMLVMMMLWIVLVMLMMLKSNCHSCKGPRDTTIQVFVHDHYHDTRSGGAPPGPDFKLEAIRAS